MSSVLNLTTTLKDRNKLYNEVIEACHFILKTDPIAEKAREYLNQRIPEEYQEKFEFGYFPSDDQLSYLSSILNPNVLQNLRLAYYRSFAGGAKLHSQLNEHNLVLPFRDVYGNVISLIGRTLNTEKNIQKYKYTLGARKDLYLFGLNQAKQTILDKDYVICVEGQFDCIACHMHGIKNVVALGWANCTQYQFFRLYRYTNNFGFLLDNDEAGLKGRKKIKERYGKYAFVKPITPPQGFKDIDNFLRSNESQSRKDDVINNLKYLGKNG